MPNSQQQKFYLVHEVVAEDLQEIGQLINEISENTGVEYKLILDEHEFNAVSKFAGKKVGND